TLLAQVPGLASVCSSSALPSSSAPVSAVPSSIAPTTPDYTPSAPVTTAHQPPPITSSAPQPSPTPSPAPSGPAGSHLVFSDDFDSLNTKKWNVRNNTWANNEQSIDTSRLENVFLSD